MTELLALHMWVDASTWIFTAALHGVTAHAVALLAGRTVVRTPRARNLLWKSALILPLITTTVVSAGWLPTVRLGEITVSGVARSIAPRSDRRVIAERRATIRNGAPEMNSVFATDSLGVAAAEGAITLAIASALVGLAGLIIRRRAFHRRLGTRTRIAACDDVAISGFTLSASESLGAPVALGVAEVCVPGIMFARLSPIERRSVLAHEVAHLDRGDPSWFAAADLLVALMPWQPLVRAIVRQLRRDAEFCCDDAVLARVGDGRALVRSLATFATAFDPAETAFAASCGGSPLEERVRRILSPATRAGRGSAIALAVTLIVLGGGLLAAAPAISTRVNVLDLPPGAHVVERHVVRVDTLERQLRPL